jgi:hypothetical protein
MQDLLQLEQFLLAVVPPPVGRRTGRLEQPDRVVVPQGPRGHARSLRDLGDRPDHFRPPID